LLLFKDAYNNVDNVNMLAFRRSSLNLIGIVQKRFKEDTDAPLVQFA
jgi:hypothetical protein